jgi:hypothetical protein
MWEGPPLEAWAAWDPWEVADRLRGMTAPWWVVGGWAIELAFGERDSSGLRHREHEDIEIEVLRADWVAVRDALGPRFAFHPVGDGAVLGALVGDAAPDGPDHQTWVEEIDAQRWRMDVMLQPGSVDEWVYRRDDSLRGPRSTMVATTRDGIPYLLPHAVLFYKAKAARPKDELDLEVMLPLLADAERAWLRAALARFHPGHGWLTLL